MTTVHIYKSLISQCVVNIDWQSLYKKDWYLSFYLLFIHCICKLPHLHNYEYSLNLHMDRVNRIWYLSPMRAAEVQASLRICAVSPEPPLLAHTGSESRGIFRQKARYLALLNGWACAVKNCQSQNARRHKFLEGAHISEKIHKNWETKQI